jgi:hypothetical protein
MAQISVSNINNAYDNRWQCYTKNCGSVAVRKCYRKKNKMNASDSDDGY